MIFNLTGHRSVVLPEKTIGELGLVDRSVVDSILNLAKRQTIPLTASFVFECVNRILTHLEHDYNETLVTIPDLLIGVPKVAALDPTNPLYQPLVEALDNNGWKSQIVNPS